MISSQTVDRVATGVIWAVSIAIVALLLWFIGYILIQGVPHLSWSFLTGGEKIAQAGSGIGPQLFNSIYFLFLALLICVPLGLSAGIYIAEFLPPGRFADILDLCTESLASLPSIVVGLFGLLVFVQKTGWGYTLLGGAFAVAILNVPVLTRVTTVSIRSTPRDLREASFGMGATRWHTTMHILLPAAVPGLVTGIILTAGRIFGEAAALIYTAGLTTPPLNFSIWNPFNPQSFLSPMRPAETLAVHIWKLNTEGLAPDRTAIANGASAVLIIFVLIFNLSSRFMGRWLYRKMTAV
jgi:phosphate transport system permease protein